MGADHITKFRDYKRRAADGSTKCELVIEPVMAGKLTLCRAK